MLRRLALRRCLHTPPPRPQARYNSSHLRFTLGVSVIAATYLTWRLTSDSHYIALDSPENISSLKQPSPLSKPTLSNPSHPKVPSPDSTPPPLNHDSGYEKNPPSEPDSEGSREGLDDTTKTDAEGESSDEGAFNPVTGEINWDCPCLGGMAHGPCGAEFREAFSCFVYSEDEPKGINCVEKFKGMQDCFRAHPDLYGEEIMDEDDDDEPATLDRGQGDKDDVVPLSTNSEVDEKKNVDPEPPTNQPPKRKSKPQAKTSQAALSFQSESSAQPPSSPVPSL